VDEFRLPLFFDYFATFVWAISGALVAARSRFDVAGVAAVAFASALGGGLIRDGIFLQSGPPAVVRDPTFLILIIAATACVASFGARIQDMKNFGRLVAVLDAVGIGIYAVVGMQKSIVAGLSLPGVVLVGIINAVGGSILRDLLVGRKPLLFQPGTLMALAALGASLVYLTMSVLLKLEPIASAWTAIAVGFVIRAASVRYNIATRPIRGFDEHESGGGI